LSNGKKPGTLSKVLFNYTLFAIAMAYLETTVVIYLRRLYYPGGFQFPMIAIPPHMALIEIGREAATLIMLWFAARLSGRPFKERFTLFVFTFAVWDIFYYVWLKVLIHWPASWLDWDILFLIPLPWIAPWLAPALISCAFIFAAVFILRFPERFSDKIFNIYGWLAEFVAAGLILISFFWQTGSVLRGGVPGYYPWWLLLIGLIIGLANFFIFFFGKKGSG